MNLNKAEHNRFPNISILIINHLYIVNNIYKIYLTKGISYHHNCFNYLFKAFMFELILYNTLVNNLNPIRDSPDQCLELWWLLSE
jgi:hypothetical protein